SSVAVSTSRAERTSSPESWRAANPSVAIPPSDINAAMGAETGAPTTACVPALRTRSPVRAARSRSIAGDRQTFPVHTARMSIFTPTVCPAIGEFVPAKVPSSGTLSPMATTTPEKTSGVKGALDRYFSITERGSTFSRELRGGLVTFLAMCYILALNPIILGGADGTGAVLGMPRIAAATALIAGLLTITMGIVARFPLAIAAGLGLNALVAFGIASIPDMTWADAMGLVVLEGIIILILVFTGFREAVFKAVPAELK